MNKEIQKEANEIVRKLLKWAISSEVNCDTLLELRICLTKISDVKKSLLEITNLEDTESWVSKMTIKVLKGLETNNN